MKLSLLAIGDQGYSDDVDLRGVFSGPYPYNFLNLHVEYGLLARSGQVRIGL